MEVCTPPPLPTGATLALALAEPTLLAVALVLALEVALERQEERGAGGLRGSGPRLVAAS